MDTPSSTAAVVPTLRNLRCAPVPAPVHGHQRWYLFVSFFFMFFAQILVFPCFERIFHFFFNYWNAKRSKYFPVFLRTKRKIWGKVV